ncbi:hypothetical protein HanIR_Chr16g0800121 [Helianthus annuus]|nr:hypothetical protein HanIR_Chr16g0800121 [Helianthus annuus]
MVSKVVESVMSENVSTKNGNSESQDEDEESFHKNYLKNSKPEKNANDDPTILAYYMIGLDKLFSDVEFPIQNVISDKIDKVFKLVEIEKSEISKYAGKSKKTFYNKPGYKKKNMKAGLGYKRNKIKEKGLKRQTFRKRRTLFTGQLQKKRKNSNLDDSLMKSSMLRKNNNNRSKMFQRKHALNVNKLDMLVVNVHKI